MFTSKTGGQTSTQTFARGGRASARGATCVAPSPQKQKKKRQRQRLSNQKQIALALALSLASQQAEQTSPLSLRIRVMVEEEAAEKGRAGGHRTFSQMPLFVPRRTAV